MEAIIKFDLTNEDDRSKYGDYLRMEATGRFWDVLYGEVFREQIRYSNCEKTIATYQKVWDEVSHLMEDLRHDP